MIAKAEKFEKHLEAVGSGAFGKVEYNGNGIILRSSTLKTPDRGSSVRMYFDGDRNQVMTGRRFDIMGELWLMRQNNAYRIYTNVVLDKKLPDDVVAHVELSEDAKDVMGLMSASVVVGEPISFTVFTFRAIEFEKMTTLATLVFHEEVKPKAPAKPKGKGKGTGNSTRTKKDDKPKEGEGDESDIPEETPSEEAS